MKLIGLFIAVFSVPLAFAQDRMASSQLEGTVVQLKGEPLGDATVYALRADAMDRPPLIVQADVYGKFRYTNLNPGSYYLDAAKEDGGYIYSIFSFYVMPGQRKPEVTLVAGESKANVIIQLGEMTAYLVLNITTTDGAAPEQISAVFKRPDLPGTFSTSVVNGSRIPVPPVPFSLEVRAKGNARWSYKSSAGASLLKLNPNQTEHLAVILQR